MIRPALLLILLALASAGAGAASAARPSEPTPEPTVSVVIELDVPPVARAATGRTTARVALERVVSARRRLEARLAARVPDARVTWRYGVVVAGLAVDVPAGEVALLASLPGVRAVYPSVTYQALDDEPDRLERVVAAARAALETPSAIGAPSLWGPDLGQAGEGIKIGIIDDGIDPRHPYFSPNGYTMPEGFPLGVRSLTSAKVIVARAFPPPNAGWRFAGRPFDPLLSVHGTHVAGIAAGNAGTVVPAGSAAGRPRPIAISGVAPRAYLGNYKALTVPTPGFGLNGNSPELVAAIEAAVADGMDVINLSLGEPEVEPSRDIVARALDAAAAAGVVPVVAAGNEYSELGRGSVGSPGSSTRAITVAATDEGGEIAGFSSAGPTPLGYAPKPDVAAPGVGVLSSVPGGRYEQFSGTSMATPAVAGGAALLLQREPQWTPGQVKSALVLTARATRAGRSEAPSSRTGSGTVELTAAIAPLVEATPQSFGFGLVDVSGGERRAEGAVELADAGGGAGSWEVTVVDAGAAEGVVIEAPATVVVPGELRLAVVATAAAPQGAHAGVVLLRRGPVTRRVPLWFRVTRPALPSAPARTLTGPGTFRATTRGGANLVSVYRYPDAPPWTAPRLRGPERVFRLTLERPVANLGVAIVAEARGTDVETRIVRGQDENAMTGATSLPYVANPYLPSFGAATDSAAALLPVAGEYAVVFDSRRPADAGPFRFRVWVDDVAPPTVQLRSTTVTDGRLVARVTDRGSGVAPDGIRYSVDGGRERNGRLAGGLAVLPLEALRPGRHRLVLAVSDRQEAKNTENVPGILPNTTVVTATIRVR